MREVYSTKVIGELEQGTIINNCIAENYKGLEIFGIIITPRCDIGNAKVSTIHYLPIIKFDDWIKIDYWDIFSHRAKTEAINKIGSILDKYKISRTILHLLNYTDTEQLLQKIIKKPDDYTKVKKYLTHLQNLSLPFPNLSNIIVKELLDEYHKVSKEIFKDLKENKRKEFYLIESWDDAKKYYIVLLREIRKITFDLAEKLSYGIYEYEIPEGELLKNDIARSSKKDNFTYTIATLKSPHIEHLIQQFFLNFGRIGVQNHPSDLEYLFFEQMHNTL